MAVCSTIKADGNKCRAQAMSDSEWCYTHNPDLSDKRQRNNRKGGRRGGRGRPQAEVADVKVQLQDLADRVLSGDVNKGEAAVVSQIYNVLLRAVSVELKVREQLELEERIASLESLLEEKQEGGGW